MGRFGVKYSGSVAGTAAKAGGHTTATVNTDTTAGIYSTVTGASTAATGIVDKYNGVTATAASNALTAGFGAPALTNNAAASTSAQLAAMQSALTIAQTQLAAVVASNAASQAASPTSTSTLEADIKALGAAIAAASGTPAVEAIASDTLITSRLDININASTETDSGVTFGTMVRIRSDEGGTGGLNSARFYAKSGGLELGVGNIHGAMDSMPGAYGQSVGLTGLGYAGLVTGSAMSYSGAGAGAAGTKEAAEVKYSMGDFSAHVSTNGTDTEGFAAFSAGGFTVALATSDSDVATSTETAATVSGKIGDVTVGAAWAETVGNTAQYTLSAAMSVGAATTVKAYYNDNEANTVDDKSYGLGFSHGLGGGTSLVGGVASVNDRTLADFGVSFNF
jgi:outer membrane protein OmpU